MAAGSCILEWGQQLRMRERGKKVGVEELEINNSYMILLCLSVFQSNSLGSRKLKDGDDGLEQGNRSYALDWATMENGRTRLLAGILNYP